MVEKPAVANRQYSIQQTLEKQRLEREALQNITKVKTEFNQEQLLTAWNEVIIAFEKNHSDSAVLINSIKKANPNRIKDELIHIELPSTSLCREFDLQKSHFLPPLRSLLKNDYIELEAKLSETSERIVNENLPDEIYKSMLQKNPLLAQLIKKLDLEITDE